MNVSITYVSALAGFLVALFALFNVHIEQEVVLKFVTAFVSLLATTATLYGRFRAGGLHWWGIKKKK